MLTIQIEYKAIPPRRKGVTIAIATALRTLKTVPKDAEGNPGSFAIPKKHRRAVLIAAKDVGVEVETFAEEGDLVRVALAVPKPEEKTMSLDFEGQTAS